MINTQTYSSLEVVNAYAKSSKIQLPEKTLLELLEGKIHNFFMLDVGVGGGRTTLFFGDKVKKYIGTDISQEMVNACKNRFNNTPELEFEVADASDLKIFPENYFNLVLFSFNGIDYITQNEKRKKALTEMQRVLTDGGILFFSSHNSQSIPKILKIHFTPHPIKFLWRICRFFILLWLNRGSLSPNKKTLINDGAWNFKLTTMYIPPKIQFEELRELGFSNIKAFSIVDGKEIDESLLEINTDSRIYYYAQKKL